MPRAGRALKLTDEEVRILSDLTREAADRQEKIAKSRTEVGRYNANDWAVYDALIRLNSKMRDENSRRFIAGVFKMEKQEAISSQTL